MPRDGGGIYTLPAGNPVVPLTIIETDWANPTMEDLGVALSDSLSRSGKGGMTASLRGPDGSAAVPTFSFTNEVNTGRFRAGPGQVVEAVQGVPVVRYTAAGLEQWNGSIWEPLTPRDAKDTPFDPAPTALTSTNVQDAIEEVFAATGGVPTADGVTYDDTLVYFGAATVQIAIDTLGIDLSAVASDVAANAGDIQVNTGDIALLNDSILGLVDDVNKNEADIVLVNNRVDNVEQTNDDQDIEISNIKLEQIQQNNDITDNFNTLASHNTRITNNEIGVGANATDIATILAAFPGGILGVINGGTGVSSSTGSGSVVLNSSPTIGTAQLNNPTMSGAVELGTGAMTDTKASNDNDRSVASTAFVQSAILAATANLVSIEHSQNGNGSYIRFKIGGTTQFVVQWGNALFGNIGNRTISFPVSFPDSGNVRVMMQQFGSSISGGRDWAPTVNNITASSFQYGASYDCIWIAVGRNS